MLETLIESVLRGRISQDVVIRWLNDEKIEDTPEYSPLLCCSRSEFVAYFLSFLRTQTDSILQTNTNALSIINHQNTPEKLLNSKRKHHRSCSDPTSDPKADQSTDSLSVKTDRRRSHESPNRDRSTSKKSGRRVKTKLFSDQDKSNQSFNYSGSVKTDSDESRLSTGVEKIAISSTPMKNGITPSEYSNLSLTSPVTPQSRSYGRDLHERCDTPRTSHRHSKSQEKSNFGDFLVAAHASKSGKKKRAPKNVSNEAENVESKVNLDLSSSEMFPEIGARKSSSLRSEKRRIKPTNIDTSTPQKSFSLNSFNSEVFQQPSPLALEENLAFKYQNIQPRESATSFEAERSILKQERQKLMEKFNVLNTSSVPVTPLIKVTNKEFPEKQEVLVDADLTKVLLKDKLDFLIEIYELLVKSNLILSVTSEIYFLISVLLSKQHEADHVNIQAKLTSETASEYILKTIHNSTYFAVKSLWHQRHILEFMLDKPSLKILGENKKVRSFYPELAKFLLNLYGIKCEMDTNKDDKVIVLEHRFNNGMVCFNSETDNADNFPSLLSFQNFKKQRDMFYEILRWYKENQQSGAARSTFRSRVKALLSLAVSPANAAHLARLYTAHMIAECLPDDQPESKLSKLQRRFTGPATHESQRLPRFTHKEMFYKEFVIFAENESFRVHLRDCIASEICTLNAHGIGSTEERGNSKATDLTKEYLKLVIKLRLLAKFLGFLSSLPYTQIPVEYTIKTGQVNCIVQKEQTYTVPKEKVLENDLAMRNYSQPPIDLKGILTDADEKWRLCVTLPWIVQYLAMIDYTTLRTNYYQNLLKKLFQIYIEKLKLNNSTHLKKNTIIFLKLTLGWLFDLTHFPQDLFYESAILKSNMAAEAPPEESLDSFDLIDESILFEACPFLKDINVLLVTSKPTSDVKDVGSFRHITPVTMSLNAEDRMRNKEKEIQARLEEEFLKSQPQSTRRVVELVAERVTSRGVRQLQPRLKEARRRARQEAALVVKAGGQGDLTQAVRAIYEKHLDQLRVAALAASRKHAAERVSTALAALLAPGGDQRPLDALAARLCYKRTQHWIQHNWDTIDILCKDIEGEIKNLQVLGDSMLSDDGIKPSTNVEAMLLPSEQFDNLNVSPSATLIEIKEQICLLLEYSEPQVSLRDTLAHCVHAVRPNNIFTRPPAKKALLQLTVDLCLVVASRKPKEITDQFLNLFHVVWNECCTDRKRKPTEPEVEPTPERNFTEDDRAPTPVSDEEKPPETTQNTGNYKSPGVSSLSPNTSASIFFGNQNSPNFHTTVGPKTARMSPSYTIPVQSSVPKSPGPEVRVEEDYLEYFDRILCPRNIVLLSESRCKASEVWDAMAVVLVFLMKMNYVSEDSVTEQCLAVYRQEWPQSVLSSLSRCMHRVSRGGAGGKFVLFLQLLAEYCEDMD